MSKGLEHPQGPVVSRVGTLCCTVTVLSPPTPRSRMVHPFSCFPWEHTGTSRPRWDRETDPLRLAGREKVGCCFPTSPRHGHPCQHVDSSPIPGQKEQGRGGLVHLGGPGWPGLHSGQALQGPVRWLLRCALHHPRPKRSSARGLPGQLRRSHCFAGRGFRPGLSRPTRPTGVQGEGWASQSDSPGSPDLLLSHSCT